MTKILIILLAILTTSVFGNTTSAQSNTTFKTFTDWCKNKEHLTPEAQHTIEVVLKTARIEDCDRVGDLLTRLTELKLSHRDIKDISPLATLTHLTVLDLSLNDIKNVTHLQNLI
jgi:internalin A